MRGRGTRPTIGVARLPNGRDLSTKRLASKRLPVREAAAPAEPDSRRPSPVPVCSPTSPAASGCATSELRLRRTSRAFIRLQPLWLVLFSASPHRAISSVVERLLHTQEVAGSNPASRTSLFRFEVLGSKNKAEPSLLYAAQSCSTDLILL